ncbi:MAG: hypothetical protein H7249_13325 [Chitinophagaceae bacterium]|nr:hypothetical protein [Oligoflexus sp.]
MSITFTPFVSMVLGVGVGAELGALGLLIEGDLTLLAYELPVTFNIGGTVASGLYYSAVTFVPIQFMALGGSGISLVGKLEVPKIRSKCP